MNKIKATLFTFICTFIFSANVFAVPVATYDWNDGTLQGWTKKLPFNGTLGVNTSFGNGGGSMYATDTLGGGGGLVAIAPGWTGDFSQYSGISWDEYVPDYGSATRISTSVYVEGSDGTRFRTDQTLKGTNTWTSTFAALNLTDWTFVANSGNLSFTDVLNNVSGLYISMDTSVNANGNVESYVDNFSIHASAPEPTALALIGLGLTGIGFVRRKKTA